jgi:hypothetical protein
MTNLCASEFGALIRGSSVMKHYRKKYDKLDLIDMEEELVRLVRMLLGDQRHMTKTHNAREIKRLLGFMVDEYEKLEKN